MDVFDATVTAGISWDGGKSGARMETALIQSIFRRIGGRQFRRAMSVPLDVCPDSPDQTSGRVDARIHNTRFCLHSTSNASCSISDLRSDGYRSVEPPSNDATIRRRGCL